MTDQQDSELRNLELQNTMRKRKRETEAEEFISHHRKDIDINIPFAENFVIEFCEEVLKPLTLEENNQLLAKMGVTEDEEVKLVRLVNDALKLAKVNKLEGHIETSEVTGYDASKNTRAFTTNMLFLNFRGEAGTNSLLGLQMHL